MQADKKTIIRRCVDMLHKYATDEQVAAVAAILNVDLEVKKER